MDRAKGNQLFIKPLGIGYYTILNDNSSPRFYSE